MTTIFSSGELCFKGWKSIKMSFLHEAFKLLLQHNENEVIA